MGLEMHIWTVNEEAEMRNLLELGIDGIITDFPARLQAIMAEH
jgi:glycerophosphoryl diester phosphodiesterase